MYVSFIQEIIETWDANARNSCDEHSVVPITFKMPRSRIQARFAQSYEYCTCACMQHTNAFRNHRMLDLRAFRGLVERGLIPAEDFITIETGQQQVVTRHFRNAINVRNFYEDKSQYKVRALMHSLYRWSRVYVELGEGKLRTGCEYMQGSLCFVPRQPACYCARAGVSLPPPDSSLSPSPPYAPI